MIRDAKEVRRYFEREKNKVLANSKSSQRKKGEVIDPRDIKVKQGLEIPTDESDQLPPATQLSDESSDEVEGNKNLSKRSTIRTVRR